MKWLEAVAIWRAQGGKGAIPKTGTPGHDAIKAIQNAQAPPPAAEEPPPAPKRKPYVKKATLLQQLLAEKEAEDELDDLAKGVGGIKISAAAPPLPPPNATTLSIGGLSEIKKEYVKPTLEALFAQEATVFLRGSPQPITATLTERAGERWRIDSSPSVGGGGSAAAAAALPMPGKKVISLTTRVLERQEALGRDLSAEEKRQVAIEVDKERKGLPTAVLPKAKGAWELKREAKKAAEDAEYKEYVERQAKANESMLRKRRREVEKYGRVYHSLPTWIQHPEWEGVGEDIPMDVKQNMKEIVEIMLDTGEIKKGAKTESDQRAYESMLRWVFVEPQAVRSAILKQFVSPGQLLDDHPTPLHLEFYIPEGRTEPTAEQEVFYDLQLTIPKQPAGQPLRRWKKPEGYMTPEEQKIQKQKFLQSLLLEGIKLFKGGEGIGAFHDRSMCSSSLTRPHTIMDCPIYQVASCNMCNTRGHYTTRCPQEDSIARFRNFGSGRSMMSILPGYDRELIVGDTQEAIAEILVLAGLKPITAEEAVSMEEDRKKKEADDERFNKQYFGRRTKAEEAAELEEAEKEDAEAEGKPYVPTPAPKEKSIPELMLRFNRKLLHTLGDACLIPFTVAYGGRKHERLKGLEDGRNLEQLLAVEELTIEEVAAIRKQYSKRK